MFLLSCSIWISSAPLEISRILFAFSKISSLLYLPFYLLTIKYDSFKRNKQTLKYRLIWPFFFFCWPGLAHRSFGVKEKITSNLLGAGLSVIHHMQRTARKIYRFVTKSLENRTDSIKEIYVLFNTSLFMLNRSSAQRWKNYTDFISTSRKSIDNSYCSHYDEKLLQSV